MPTLASIRNKLGDFSDRFSELERLGTGAEGGTWVAVDCDRKRQVVLKFVPDGRMAQVARAFRVLRRVSSPHLPAALELLAVPDGAWLVTSWIPGNQLIVGAVPAAQVVVEGVAITHALRAIHSAGTHHGDVSLGNVIRTPEGEVVLTDFGQLGCYACGTPGFLAPEVLAGGGGPAADLFALGCLLCARLLGSVPWRDPSDVVRVERHHVGERLEELAATHDIERPLLALIGHLLDPDPERRQLDLGVLLSRLLRMQQSFQAREGAASGTDIGWWVPARWPYRGVEVESLAIALSDAHTRPRIVAVAGPAGSGRRRVVEEIVHGLQSARAGGDDQAPPASLCAPSRLAAHFGGTDDWLPAWIAGREAHVLGVCGPLQWSGELASEQDLRRRAAMQAAVLVGAAWLAGATIVAPVGKELADALDATLPAAGAPVHVLRVEPWSADEIAEVMSELQGPGLEDELRARWVRAVVESTQGWPGRVVRSLEACARQGLNRPDFSLLAQVAQSVAPLDPALAQAVVRGAWDGDEDSLLAYPAARLVVGEACQSWARAELKRKQTADEPRGLCLLLDAEDLEQLASWVDTHVGQRALQERERVLLMQWCAAGGLMRLPGPTRERIAEYFLRKGDAGWVLQCLFDQASSASERTAGEQALVVRALEQVGRASEALAHISTIERDAPSQTWQDSLHGLRWRAMTDLGRAREALALARAWVDKGPHNLDVGAAEAWLWAALAGLMQGEDLLAEQWLAAARRALGELESTTGKSMLVQPSSPGPARRALGLLARVEQLEGNLAHARGQFHRASDHYRQACDAFVAAGEPGGQVLLWANLAALALIGGDTSRGVEAGRRALAGQLARGRMQALPAIVANLVGLLVRVGALDEASVQVELLRGLLAAMQAPGEVAWARLHSAEAEVLWARHRQKRPLDPANRAACAGAFTKAATALAASGCTRESVASWLRAGMVERLGGRLEVAALHREQAREIAAGLEDHSCELWLALEEIAWASKAEDPERFIRVCESLRLLTRPSELRQSGRLELALAYDRALALALHHFYGADHPRTVAAAQRARQTLETIMNQIDPIDRQAVRQHMIDEADEPEVLRELLDPPAATAEPGEQTVVTPPGPTRRQSSRHERLIRIYRRLAREDELERLLVQVVEAMMELSDAERGVVVVSAPSAPAGERIQVARELAPGSEGVVYSRSVIESVLQDGRPILSVDAAEDDRFDGSRSVSHLNLRSVLAVPLVFRGEVLGAAYVDHRLRRGAFDETDLAHIEEFAELAALAVAHARTIAAQRQQATALEHQGKELARLLDERESEVRGLREEMRDRRVAERKIYRGMVGASPGMQEVFRLIDRLANSTVSVVVYGESGTGKELVSRAIHDAGERRNKPFVAENCGAIPESLLESVLFGHARGAFTGAHRASPGLFEAANGGTIFLDEIGEMSPAMQTKLLRVLQEGVVRRVGETTAREIDVRVIAASNRDLDEMVRVGSFRQDLFYRIQVVKIALPPLRMRTQDLSSLIAHFLGRYDAKQQLTVSAAAMRVLARYAWPGNIRELENEIQRWVVLAEGRVEPDDLSPGIQGAGEADGPDPDDLRIKPRVERLERDLIARALERCAGNQTRAAELLGVSRYGLQKKIRRFASEDT